MIRYPCLWNMATCSTIIKETKSYVVPSHSIYLALHLVEVYQGGRLLGCQPCQPCSLSNAPHTTSWPRIIPRVMHIPEITNCTTRLNSQMSLKRNLEASAAQEPNSRRSASKCRTSNAASPMAAPLLRRIGVISSRPSKPRR